MFSSIYSKVSLNRELSFLRYIKNSGCLLIHRCFCQGEYFKFVWIVRLETYGPMNHLIREGAESGDLDLVTALLVFIGRILQTHRNANKTESILETHNRGWGIGIGHGCSGQN